LKRRPKKCKSGRGPGDGNKQADNGVHQQQETCTGKEGDKGRSNDSLRRRDVAEPACNKRQRGIDTCPGCAKETEDFISDLMRFLRMP
jgi:hypothetical protein